MTEGDDSTRRFSNRVQDYVRYRPGYPQAVAKLLAAKADLTSESVVADVGSGTGLLSSVFLESGYIVIGVEPNREMREAGETLLGANSRFRSVNATAEATSLPDRSIDLVVAGQAFHWFDIHKTRCEWQRILKPNGIVALIWNERHLEAPLMREVEAVIDKFAAALDPGGVIREGGRSRIEPFFRPALVQLNEFDHRQEFDLEGLVGRVASSSYVPTEKDSGFAEMKADLTDVFNRYQSNGAIPFEYRTKVYWGRLFGETYSGV